MTKTIRDNYVGVPAPPVLQDDPWFGPAIKSEKQMAYEAMLKEVQYEVEEYRQYWTNEPEDIHEVMYGIATKNHNTTLHIDPIGGSENVHR
jgi:hypothetical protein